ncbi:hypothetical protein RQP53_01210 [Paucibacter sp. APW11]|uniref:DUF4405 domain-containing protein n=1 Tax=Roseateles aquae TaxID=3077235 RepID=A0ABU3P5P6_9BURK|nr:hypothetical protein [Paucibacter sp. APW11]MDT8997888.1 hypothetical protein [Paucibacter sp. APW11]
MNPLLRLPRWQKRAAYFCLAVLTLSGLAWLLLHYGRADDELPLPAEGWLMRLHGLASMLALLVLGALAGQHVPAGWRLARRHRRARQRATGLLLSALLGAAVLSAYALYYLVPETWHAGLGGLHAGLGVFALLGWWLHRPRRQRI